jgi:hypothetical protein
VQELRDYASLADRIEEFWWSLYSTVGTGKYLQYRIDPSLLSTRSYVCIHTVDHSR